MLSLAHSYVALGLLKNQRLKNSEKDSLITGSIIPDVSFFGLVDHKKTHYLGLGLKNHFQKPRNNFFFFLGMLFHGENPQGLDYYTHHPEGYIAEKKRKVLRIMDNYKKHLKWVDREMAVHYLVECAVDNLIAEANKDLIKRTHSAFVNPLIKRPMIIFSRIFETRNIYPYFNDPRVGLFFKTFKNTKKTASFWLNLMNWQKANLYSQSKFIRFTHFSFGYLRNRLRRKKYYIKMFEEVKSYLENDYQDFLHQAMEKMERLKKGFV